MLSARETFLYDAVKLFDVVLLFFLCQLCVKLHEDGGIRVAHPPLERFDRDVSFVAHGGKGDAEIVAADFDILPGRELFPFPQKLLVFLRFPVPALMTSVYLIFQEADIGIILSDK